MICIYFLELKSAVGLILPTEKSLIALEQCKAIIPPNYSRCIQVNNFILFKSVDRSLFISLVWISG